MAWVITQLTNDFGVFDDDSKNNIDLFNEIAYCVEFGVFCDSVASEYTPYLGWGANITAALTEIMSAWDGEGDLVDEVDEVTEFAAYTKLLKVGP